MTDRITPLTNEPRVEAVARALFAMHAQMQTRDGVQLGAFEDQPVVALAVWFALADAALAAIDAEPTEAEIAAARQEYTTRKDAYIEQAKADGVCLAYSRDDYPECVEMIYENAGHEAMRAALMAARKARP